MRHLHLKRLLLPSLTCRCWAASREMHGSLRGVTSAHLAPSPGPPRYLCPAMCSLVAYIPKPVAAEPIQHLPVLHPEMAKMSPTLENFERVSLDIQPSLNCHESDIVVHVNARSIIPLQIRPTCLSDGRVPEERTLTEKLSTPCYQASDMITALLPDPVPVSAHSSHSS
ncbi:hypothetical protein NQZ68_032548 [Dissostichus eleginoides]|nr:hypothetical protein NQZ68_032548 [Dissostichus eleginoides]